MLVEYYPITIFYVATSKNSHKNELDILDNAFCPQQILSNAIAIIACALVLLEKFR